MDIDQRFNSIAAPDQEAAKVLNRVRTRTSGARLCGVSRRDDGRLNLMFGDPGVLGVGTTIHTFEGESSVYSWLADSLGPPNKKEKER